MSLTQNVDNGVNTGELLEKVSYLENFDLFRIAQTAWEKRWVVLFLTIAPAALVIILSISAPAKYESIAVLRTDERTTAFIHANKPGLPFWQDESPVPKIAEQNKIKLEGEMPEVRVSFRTISPVLGKATIKIVDRRPQTSRHLAKAVADYFVKRVEAIHPLRKEHALLMKNEDVMSNLHRDEIKLLKTQSAELSENALVLRDSISTLSQVEAQAGFAVMLNGQLSTTSNNLRNIDLKLLDHKRALESIKLDQAKRAALLGTIETVSISKPRRITRSVLFSAILSGLVALSIVSVALDIRRFSKEHDAVTFW